jgi:ASPIC and UnbV
VAAQLCSLLAVSPPPAAGASQRLPTRFSNITGASGIHVTGLGNASSWVDYDGDGDLDLFASSSDPGEWWRADREPMAQDSLALEFGVGAAPGPFRVRVLWPSGTIQKLTVPANGLSTIIEP